MKKKRELIEEVPIEEEAASDPDDEMEEDADITSDDPEDEVIAFVPQVTDMDSYFTKHYANRIVDELNACLADGTLAEYIHAEIKSERILPEECYVKGLSYWRLNRTDFYIDADVRIELKVQTKAGIDTDFFWLYVEFWFYMDEEDEECDFSDCGLLENKPAHEDCWKLDQYLVPVLRRDEIDKYANEIWEKYFPEALKEPLLRHPKDLATKMGLSVLTKKLHKRNNVKGIIFFRDGSVMIQPPRESGQKDDPEPIDLKVPANTVVLNLQADSSYDYDLDLYHECVHYEWHYLFYRLQEMHNSDIHKLKKVKKTLEKGQRFSGPVDFMEHQARYGSYSLMMPHDFMNETIRSIYKESFSSKRKDGYFDHDGMRFDYIGRKIADTYSLSKARVRARMLQLGYIAAVGALNYVDGRYIVPFAFSETDNSGGNYTYVIDRQSVMKLYRTDKKFKQLMQSGQFVYADGHVVHCESAGLQHTPHGARLSAWANAHMDRISLRFSKTYIGDHKYKYKFGQMNSEDALKDSMRFLDINGSLSVKEADKLKNQLMEEMPLSFHGALSYIMKGRVTVDELTRRIPISRSTLMRLRTEERKEYQLDQVIAICVGLHLPPWLSAILLEKAGLSVKRYGPKGYYGTILDCFYMDTIKEVQQFLSDNGYDELMLNFDPDVEYGDDLTDVS